MENKKETKQKLNKEDLNKAQGGARMYEDIELPDDPIIPPTTTMSNPTKEDKQKKDNAYYR